MGIRSVGRPGLLPRCHTRSALFWFCLPACFDTFGFARFPSGTGRLAPLFPKRAAGRFWLDLGAVGVWSRGREGSRTQERGGSDRKRDRASGGCLGARRRGRTCQATKRCGEPQARCDPQISEWGNPAGVMTRHPAFNGGEGTRGTETSKYPQEKKADAMAQVAASERASA